MKKIVKMQGLDIPIFYFDGEDVPEPFVPRKKKGA